MVEKLRGCYSHHSRASKMEVKGRGPPRHPLRPPPPHAAIFNEANRPPIIEGGQSGQGSPLRLSTL